jgi:hypothetical protein
MLDGDLGEAHDLISSVSLRVTKTQRILVGFGTSFFCYAPAEHPFPAAHAGMTYAVARDESVLPWAWMRSKLMKRGSIYPSSELLAPPPTATRFHFSMRRLATASAG